MDSAAHRILCAGLFCLLGVACSDKPKPAPILHPRLRVDAGLDDADGGAAADAGAVSDVAPSWLDDQAQALSRAHAGAAVTLLVRFADGRTWSVAAGQRSQGGDPAEPSDRVEFGSDTALFTATAVLKLQEAGQLNVDHPITDYLPFADGVDETFLQDLFALPVSQVRVWNLMNHTSGMGDYLAIGSGDADTLAFYRDKGDDYSPRQLLELTRDVGTPAVDPTLTPGVARYSNAGYVLLGMLIEKVSGMSWEDYVQQALLDPLGLSHIAFLTRGASSPRQGYAQGQEAVSTPGSLLWSAGALVGDPADQATFMYQLANGGVYENAATWGYQVEGHVSSLNMLPYGLGIFRYPSAISQTLVGLPHNMLTHPGQTFGFIYQPYYDETTRAVVVTSVNDAQADSGEASALQIAMEVQARLSAQ